MEKITKSKKGKRAKKHGFLHRSKNHAGKNVLKRRKAAKRKTLTV